MSQVWIGLFGSIAIAGIAYWKQSLSGSGAVAAVFVGTILYSTGSLPWFGTMIAFFVFSSLLSQWKKRNKENMERMYEKTGRRDAGQVLANGGLAVGMSLLHGIWPLPVFWYAFLGIMATVNADTWATEIGSLSKKSPVSILTGRTVHPGTSGGITALGLLATVLGSIFIGAVATILLFIHWKETISHVPFPFAHVVAINIGVTFLAGTIGCLADSLLGATVQVMYACDACGLEVETAMHCQKAAKKIRGFSFFSNDRVNSFSSFIGGAAAMMASFIIGA
ncbi:DUF92 domain-containing protein [Fodinisporobacter ferrooxydans]|uniref:DUF92 domain-containing protein n=1 Tax=Fodinisporobacter ferrooxydans TaxID=2901836 RepID=A0ABY4CHG9_9BACL|nr:DUF92 domain-containing protein [Alicyclobacillaceae bacterium MYW30-H2]